MERRFWISAKTWNPAATNKTTGVLEKPCLVMMHCNDLITNEQMAELDNIWEELDRESWLKKLNGQRKMDESTSMEIFYLRKEQCHEEAD